MSLTQVCVSSWEGERRTARRNLLSFLQLSKARLKPDSTKGRGGLGVYVSSNSRMNLWAVSAGGSWRLELCALKVNMLRNILERKDGTKKDNGDKIVLKRRNSKLKGVTSGEKRKGGR